MLWTTATSCQNLNIISNDLGARSTKTVNGVLCKDGLATTNICNLFWNNSFLRRGNSNCRILGRYKLTEGSFSKTHFFGSGSLVSYSWGSCAVPSSYFRNSFSLKSYHRFPKNQIFLKWYIPNISIYPQWVGVSHRRISSVSPRNLRFGHTNWVSLHSPHPLSVATLYVN